MIFWMFGKTIRLLVSCKSVSCKNIFISIHEMIKPDESCLKYKFLHKLITRTWKTCCNQSKVHSEKNNFKVWKSKLNISCEIRYCVCFIKCDPLQLELLKITFKSCFICETNVRGNFVWKAPGFLYDASGF